MPNIKLFHPSFQLLQYGIMINILKIHEVTIYFKNYSNPKRNSYLKSQHLLLSQIY